MKQYAGMYELQSHENFAQYYKDISPVLDDDVISIINRMEDNRTIIEIQVDGDQVKINKDSYCLKITIGEPCFYEMYPGIVVQCTSAFAGNVLTIGVTVDDAPLQIREFVFTDKSLTITYTGKNTKQVAKSTYTKI